MKTNQALQDKLSTEIKELKIKKFNQDKKDKAEDKGYFWRNSDKGGPAPPLHDRRRRDAASFCPPPSAQRSSTTVSSASSGTFLSNERLDRRKGAGGRRHAHRRDAAPDVVRRNDYQIAEGTAHTVPEPTGLSVFNLSSLLCLQLSATILMLR